MGSSLRGLSLVRMQKSASSPAISPISGRLARSRLPPQPNSAIMRPLVVSRTALRMFSRLSGEWA